MMTRPDRKSKKLGRSLGKGASARLSVLTIEKVSPAGRAGHRSLQKAVDRVAALGGGVVEISSGLYLMENALDLRSGVRLMGEPGTLLRKVPSISSPLIQMAGFGHREFLVKDPKKFKAGMGVCLSDDKAFGFYETVGSVVGRNGDCVFIDEPFHHDYLPSQGAFVRSVFPLIRGFGVRGVSVSDLTLEAPGERHPINGCLGGAVLLLQSHEVELKNLEIRRYRGEGISFQQCTDLLIQGCHVHHNRGNGIHPGSGSVRYRILENTVQQNTHCGIFYCFRTTHSLCQGNTIQDNGRAGISLGERDTDHRLTANHLSGNGGPGIEFREKLRQSGERVRVENNVFSANCSSGGQGEISLAEGIKDVRMTGNQFLTSSVKALFLGPACRRIEFFANMVGGVRQGPDDMAGAVPSVRVTRKGAFPRVGPAAAGRDAARHLGIALLAREGGRERQGK